MELGVLVYRLYRALTYGVSPFIHLHMRWRRLRGLEHFRRWHERFGHPSAVRPPGSLVWFHAVSLGEGMAAVPVIRRCNEMKPEMTILMTTTTLSAFEVIRKQLPAGVLHQFAPLDTPVAVDRFLGYWKPNAIIIMENELWPNLIMSAALLRIPLALLNARMSTKSFKRWSSPLFLPLASLLLSKFSLIAPLSSLQGIHFQLLQAPPFVINFSGDLKYVVNKFHVSSGTSESIRDLKAQLSEMKVWIASSLHKGEEEVILGVHNLLLQSHPDSVVIIVPRHPHHGQQIAQKLRKDGQSVALRSRNEKLTSQKTNIYVVDTLGELREFYRVAPIAVIGGSFLPWLTGHNVSEAAAAGCAVITGCHVGHFSHMVEAMQQANPLSITQVSSKLELKEAIDMLLSNPEILEARQRACKEVYESLSSCIISNIWNLLNLHIFRGR
ncbi:putative 3-deoxy-D-manno-octulosonic acid transferase [Raphanus sativus]|uniref:lipid IVA 3-deoxy-D-manno-octulosonic acid transferase n=1 Tax=Raphanus sativus TaxID=3726 RepID=A0A6J0K957_RAPSA|nr:probable 3-deoxy-D-manno-octulosonic acid transferase, mitochondrial isoform X1 [Raphanus sativus]KAJ4882369.1 putative 3-deoxy-D-manno-octulosonic acid transferase [Raphanus sativus]